MTGSPKRRDWMPLVLAALVGALLFGAGVVVAVGATGGGDMMSMMGDGMSGDMDGMHEDCHRMMDEHDHHNGTARA